MQSTSVNTTEEAINLYANIDLQCCDDTPPRSRPMIVKEETPNKCEACKSLPMLHLASGSTKKSRIRSSTSLPSCVKLAEVSLTTRPRVSTSPTIGDLLGDDDLFHHHYRRTYSSTRSKRPRPHYSSRRHSPLSAHSRSSHVHHNRRKRREQQKPPSTLEASLAPSYPSYHPSAYNYSTLPTYGYYYSCNPSSYCACHMPDSYAGFYQADTVYPAWTYPSGDVYPFSHQHSVAGSRAYSTWEQVREGLHWNKASIHLFFEEARLDYSIEIARSVQSIETDRSVDSSASFQWRVLFDHDEWVSL